MLSNEASLCFDYKIVQWCQNMSKPERVLYLLLPFCCLIIFLPLVFFQKCDPGCKLGKLRSLGQKNAYVNVTFKMQIKTDQLKQKQTSCSCVFCWSSAIWANFILASSAACFSLSSLLVSSLAFFLSCSSSMARRVCASSSIETHALQKFIQLNIDHSS